MRRLGKYLAVAAITSITSTASPSDMNLDPREPQTPLFGLISCYSYNGTAWANNTRCPGSDACCGADSTCYSNRLCKKPGD
ncbi:hypothetical protein E4U54_005412, partial [Claviceps lovelessii]